tara:strand:+ start:338 stop:688 length:351 start_codon:yes stop_codon:yes gene_type:complete
MKNTTWTKGSLIGAIIAAVIASLCCIGPLFLLTIGLGGAWVSTLTQLDYLRPIGIIITVIFLILAFWKLYITSKHCSIDKSCASPQILRIQRIIFWIVTVALILLLAFPWYASLFY